MAMTKKHYEALAALNKSMSRRSDRYGRHSTGYDMALYDALVGQVKLFTEDNPRFDPVRFLLASGIEQPYVDKIIKEAKANG